MKDNPGSDYKTEKYNIEKRFFGGYDQWLDKCEAGRKWLQNQQIANIVQDKLHELDRIRYKLIAYTIMPNHVHLLIGTDMLNLSIAHKGKTKNYIITDTLRLIKGATARRCNQILKRTGPFWRHESYDHVVRNEKEMYRIIEYILANPVKAGLAKSREDWKYSYCNTTFMS